MIALTGESEEALKRRAIFTTRVNMEMKENGGGGLFIPQLQNCLLLFEIRCSKKL
jgi:hypothetical protein